MAKDIDDGSKNMDVTINPAGLIYGEIPLQISFVVAPKVALGFGAFGRVFALGSRGKALGAGGNANAKFYLSNLAFHDGWYIKPGIFAEAPIFDLLRFGTRVTGGYSWVWKSGFTLELGVGLRVAVHLGEVPSMPWFGVAGFAPDADLNIGFAF